MDDTKQHEEAIKRDIKNYSKLDRINDSEEFKVFFELQIDTVAQKMLQCFTGKGPETWEDFQRIRGEVVAYLYPIQMVRGAEVMVNQLTDQLNQYYNTKPE